MSTIYMLEKANLFIGDADPTSSNHLELLELALPQPEISSTEHAPGGGVMKVNFTTGILEALEPTFKLAGINPDRLKQFGLNSPYRQNFSAYGVVRDKRTGQAIEAKAIIEGRIARLAPDAFSPGGDFGHEYSIKEVVSYSLSMGGAEIFAVDFFTNVFRIGGADQFAEVNRILRIPSAI